MSKIMENKQMIHIATEIVIFAGVIYYFNQKNEKLLSQIQDLFHKMEEQEELLQRHEEIIKKMAALINEQKIKSSAVETDLFKKEQDRNNNKKQPIKVVKSQPIKVTFKQELPKQNKIEHRVEEISSEEESESEKEDINKDESDLDAELAEELQELENKN